MQFLKPLINYILNFLSLIIFGEKNSIKIQSRCDNPGCPHFISGDALKYNRKKCKFCREKDGSLIQRCTFQYNDGSKCRETSHKYHHHCKNEDCNGALYCETCMQCPYCNPCQ